MSVRASFVLLSLTLFSVPVAAQDSPYFVTYTHYLEERGALEIAVSSTTGLPRHGQPAYTAPWLELEYGMSGWWTTEFYLEGVTTQGQGNGFTGVRVENRFRPLQSEHRVNPVLYLEYERVNEGSRIQKEIVGAGGLVFEPVADLTREWAHEIEAKLILSSAVGGWNLSENVTMEKNLSRREGLEFGYAAGVARPLGTLANADTCRLCRENFSVGAEVYGGFGSTQGFSPAEQRHYAAPVVAWKIRSETTIKASFGVGLTDTSDRFLLRVGLAYELPTGRR